MAKNIDFMGAIFPDVPSVKLPQQGGGLVSFDDTTDATATADKILQGYTAYANGEKLVGTASGGGGALIMGAVRPDAELVQSWTYDKWIVADEGKTIPSYTTSTTTLLAGSSIETVSLDTDNYCYGVVIKALTYPKYSVSTSGSGKFILSSYASFHEVVALPQRFYPTDITPTQPRQTSLTVTRSSFLYYYDSNTIKEYNGSYGVYQSANTPSLSNNDLTIKSPDFRITGSANYYKSTYMNSTTDIRYQYIISLYRVPWDSLNIEGFNLTSLTTHIYDCLNSPSKTLT